MKKILFSLVLCLMFIVSINVYAYDVIDDTSEKVYDFGNVLSRSEENELQDLAEEFVEEYDTDLIIVTVEEGLDEYQIVTYADDFFDYNGFGIGSIRSGIIMAIDVTDQDTNMYSVAITASGDAIDLYTDSDIDKMFDHLSETKYDGVYEMCLSFVDDAEYYYHDHNPLPYIFMIVTPFIVSTIIIVVLISKNKMVRKATTATEYIEEGKINITRREDRFITTHTTRVRMSSSSGGGGSSTHRSSSGRSHGGGGRRI